MTPKKEFLNGVVDTVPLIVGAIPFGILFGALATTSGLSVWATMGLSLFVFAGSAQFIAATLVGQGAAVGIIVLTTFVVNLRHALYSASLGPYMKKLTTRWLMPLGFWMTDESYAVVIQRYQSHADAGSEYKHWYFLGSALFMYFNWQLCTAIGIVTGQSLANLSNWGLEFALVVTFVGIVVPLMTTWPMFVAGIVAASIATIGSDWPNQGGLMVASIAGIAAGYMTEILVGPNGDVATPDVINE